MSPEVFRGFVIGHPMRVYQQRSMTNNEMGRFDVPMKSKVDCRPALDNASTICEPLYALEGSQFS
jgi:hypothetical protein